MEYDKTPDRIKIDERPSDAYIDGRSFSSRTGQRHGPSPTGGKSKNGILILLASVVALIVVIIVVTALRKPDVDKDRRDDRQYGEPVAARPVVAQLEKIWQRGAARADVERCEE